MHMHTIKHEKRDSDQKIALRHGKDVVKWQGCSVDKGG